MPQFSAFALKAFKSDKKNYQHHPNREMIKKKILIIAQEMEPYTELSAISAIANRLPLYLNSSQFEVRILMPRFGLINERRHRLHEVVRLSGMNIIVNDDDYPLIIKVASLPGSRIQVYFLDNDDFFKRKFALEDEEGKMFEDNLERAVFFCKGAIETARKFGWPPDIIHCQGWITALIPFYIRTAYKNDPLFQSAKIIYSLFDNMPQTFDFKYFTERALINNLEMNDLDAALIDGKADLHKLAILNSDGIIKGDKDTNELYSQLITYAEKPSVEIIDTESSGKTTGDFYETLLVEE